ncbi:MAG TPA: hypothetical protein VD994_09790 [Prosthecobacter sp.]|nr:hypothetical protein [Prosthecobacter sp.]
MKRVLSVLILSFLLGPALLAQSAAAPDAAAIAPPDLPPPVSAPPLSAVSGAPVAPPLPGQLQAAPALPPPTPRPALSPPPNRIPDLPKPEFTPAPTVPLNRAGAKPASSTSTSGQFIVHGDDLKLRSAFSGRCEEVAESLRQLLRDKQQWELPIVVLLKTGEAARVPGPAVSRTISQFTHGGFHLQINVNVRGDLRPADVRDELIRVLLAERILRHQKELAIDRARLLPDWVFTGVVEALEYRQRARPSALFAAIFKSGKIYGIEEIIEASADAIEDGLSKTIYQTSCCALVLAVLDHPDGGLRMMKFLNALASDKRSERELLNQWFPGFAATPASLNKWWSLQMATLASPSVSEPLTTVETAKRLEQALTLQFKAAASELPAPRPRPVVASAPPTVESPESKADAASAEATVAETEEKKPSFLRRLNPFAQKERSDSEVIEDAAAEAALAESKSPPPPTPAPPPARKPLFSRQKDTEKEPDPAPAPEPTPPEAPKPVAETKPVAEKAPPSVAKVETKEEKPADEQKEKAKDKDTEGKASVLNPLNWFRGGKKEKPKDETDPPAEAPAPKKPEQAAKSVTAGALLQAWSPLAGKLYLVAAEAKAEADAKAETEGPRKTEGFLGLKFGRKKQKPEAQPEAPAVEAPKTKESTKPEPKKSEPGKPEEPPALKAEPSAKPAKDSPPTPEPAAAEAPKPPPPAPIKIKPLFGGSKKDAPEAAPAEAKPQETPPPPAPVAQAPEPKSKPKTKPRSESAAAPAALVDAAIPIEEYAVIMKRKDRAEILKHSINSLAALQGRAAVLYRPIVTEYSEVLSDLLQGKTKGVDERLRSLRARSAKALAQGKAVRDFVDLYEANESPVFSGLFDDYLKLPETINQELPARVDPMSTYLDALDREFSKE